MNLTAPIRRRALAAPKRPALVEGETTYDFGRMWSSIARMAALLQESGLGPGDRVMVWIPNGAAFLVAHLGAMAAGLLSVPVKAENGPLELETAIADSKPSLLVAHRDLLAKLPDGTPPGLPVVDAADLPLDGPPFDRPPEEVPDDHPGAAIYSYYFGEGRPYAAVLTHGNHLFAATHCARFHNVAAGDRLLMILPMLHVFAMGMAILTSLYQGAAIYVGRSVRPRSLLETMSAHRITHLPTVPHVHASLRRFHDPERYDLSAVKHLVSGADYLPAGEHRRIQETLGVHLVQGYGLTECFPTVCNPPDAANRPGSLGIAGNPRIRYKVVDEEGRELPPGEVGEVVIDSPGVMSGYLDAPAATARVLRDGWLHSGDLGWIDRRGYLHFQGLKKPILNLYGNKVDALEVARVIEELPGVLQARIDAVRSGNGALPEVALRARVTVQPGAEVTPPAVRAHCRTRMAPYKVPQQVELQDPGARTCCDGRSPSMT